MNEEKKDYTPKAVDKVPARNTKHGIRIMNDDTLATLRLNPDQWYQVFEYTGVDFMKIYATATSSCVYWKAKLATKEYLNLETRIRRNASDKRVLVFAKLSAGNNE